MTIIYLLLVALGCLIILRAVMMLFFAEIGRKQDLIKHIYKSGTDFQIAMVIPYLDSRKIVAFQELMQALEKQDYPTTRTGIHVVTTEETAFGLPASEDLPANVKVWTYPSKHASRGQVVSWLIERLLAAGGPSKLFVFLDADDIVRPDFLRNVTTRAFDCFAMQGYIALKRPPKGAVAYIHALSARLINRIENAGRFHVGLSCKLLNSGWVVRQEILEMIPFHQGHDLDNGEYTALLNLNGYRINWAPNVVVYKEDRMEFTTVMNEAAHSFLNHIRLAIKYAVPLVIQAITRLDFGLLEQAWTMVKPPNFIIGLVGVLGVSALLANPLFPGSFYYWSIFTLIFWSTQLLSLAVARCSFKDVMVFVAVTPFVYLAGIVTFPFFLAVAVAEAFFHLNGKPRKTRVGKRFDETQPVKRQPLAEKSAGRGRKPQRLLPSLQDDEDYADEQDERAYVNVVNNVASQPISSYGATASSTGSFASIYETQIAEPELRPELPPRIQPEAAVMGQAMASRPAGLPEFSETILPITNGKNSVNCVVRTYKSLDSEGVEVFHLVFEYKNLAFTTQKYRILDQAYYELQTKLQAKGFTIVSCGSCAYFYRPTAGNAYGVAKDHGFCLYGKLGKELNLDTDSVTVVSPSCQGYTTIEQRQAALKQWQDSLQQVSLP